MALGKGIANGMPLSAYGGPRETIDAWPVGAHGTTFGGNPVAAAAATAVLDTMGDLLPHARELSAHAFERYKELAERHETIGDVRGLGLMIGVEFERDLIIIECGPDGNVLRFIPPLITEMDELDWAIDLVGEGLSSWEAT